MRYTVYRTISHDGQLLFPEIHQGTYSDINKAHEKIDRWKAEDRTVFNASLTEYEVKERP